MLQQLLAVTQTCVSVCIAVPTIATVIQGLSKRFERFKFGIFYVLIVKIRYNFTHK